MKRKTLLAALASVATTALAPLIALPSVAGAIKTPPGRVTAGHYWLTIPAGVNPSRRETYLLTVFPLNPRDPKYKFGGKRVRVQTAAFLRLPAQAGVRPDGTIDFCGPGGLLPITPPGVPRSTPRLLGERGKGLWQSFVAATGTEVGYNPLTNTAPFQFSGRFDEVKHQIKIAYTCNGFKATRTWKLTRRF